MQSGTEGGRNCWGREISYIAIVQEDINKGTMEGAGQVRENIQHLVSDTTVWQEGKQALPPRAGGWQNGCVINHNRSRSRRPGVKEAEHEGQKRRRSRRVPLFTRRVGDTRVWGSGNTRAEMSSHQKDKDGVEDPENWSRLETVF